MKKLEKGRSFMFSLFIPTGKEGVTCGNFTFIAVMNGLSAVFWRPSNSECELCSQLESKGSIQGVPFQVRYDKERQGVHLITSPDGAWQLGLTN